MSQNRLHPKFIILTLLFYIILYIVLKIFIVYTQDLYMDNKVYDKQYNIGTVQKINSYSKEQQDNTEYLESSSKKYNIKVKNYFKDFEAGDKDTNCEYYLLYDDENNLQAGFMMGVFETQIHNIKNYDEYSYYYEFNHFPFYISNLLRDYFLNKNQIKNDVDLIKYIRERKKEDVRFFTPIVKIKENYFFNFVETHLPNLDKITYIEGDFNGYMFEVEDSKQVCIIQDDQLYCLAFLNPDYFSDDMISDVVSSLIIE